MDNVTFIEIEYPTGVFTEFAIIDHGNEQFTSMTKAEYDKEQLQPIVEETTP
jgi:hypothetical protein